ncbi:MAG: twin-arginine translocase subunit TatC [Deltaproteobacteria bacterium]|nr:twin-arginine translocase subunit TatC [Deltaproteobacteria bacterium]
MKSRDMSLISHLEELRYRLIYSILFFILGTCIAFLGRGFFLTIVKEPHMWAMSKLHIQEALYVFRYQENFMGQLKLCMVAGAILSFPFLLFHFLKFVGAGLYDHEKRKLYIFLPFFFFLFVMGVLFGYFLMIPYGLYFLMSFGQDVGLAPLISFSDYINLFFLLTFVTGIVFELPLLMLFLSRLGLVDLKTFKSKRRYAIVSAFILGAIFTPPDPVTQIFLAGALIMLYECGCVLVTCFSKDKSIGSRDDAHSKKT